MGSVSEWNSMLLQLLASFIRFDHTRKGGAMEPRPHRIIVSDAMESVCHLTNCSTSGCFLILHSCCHIFYSRCEIPGLNGTDSFNRNDLNESSWISDYIPFKDSKIDTCHVYTTPGVKNRTVTCDSYVYSNEYFEKTIVTEVVHCHIGSPLSQRLSAFKWNELVLVRYAIPSNIKDRKIFSDRS